MLQTKTRLDKMAATLGKSSTTKEVVKMSKTDLPILDFAKLNMKDVKGFEVPPLRESEALETLADEMMTLLSEHGFMYVRNHGLSLEKVTALSEVTKDVFALPTETKKIYSRRDDALFHGYGTPAIERPRDAALAENYETFMVCPRIAFCWPEEVPTFKPKSLEVYYEFQELSYRVFDLLGIGLGLKDRGFLRRSHLDDHSELRETLYHRYPNDFVPKPGQLRFFPHYDLGTISFIHQDSAGGLQAQTQNGDWMPVPHIPGTVIMLIGKLMQRWTSDRLKAVFHRVVIPADQAFRQTDRQALIYFPGLADDFLFECLDGSDKYAPITFKDFCVKNIYEGEFANV